jgi:uncharacterized protein YbjT (DUF2867 family)
MRVKAGASRAPILRKRPLPMLSVPALLHSTARFADDFRAIERALGERPVDHVTLRQAVVAYARARRNDPTPEHMIRDLKAAFVPLIKEGYAEAFTLRTDAVTVAISFYYRGERIS